MVKIHCNWCGSDFETIINTTDAGERSQLRCQKCCRFLPSSIKEPTDNIIGRKHIHRDYK